MKMKYFIIAILTTISISNCYANLPGLYTGIGGGFSQLEAYSDTNVPAGTFASEAFIGYNFNQRIGLELSYLINGRTQFTLKNYYNVKVDYALKSLSLLSRIYLNTGDSPLETAFILGISQAFVIPTLEVKGYSKTNKFQFEDQKSLLLMVGGGFNYQFNKNFSSKIDLILSGRKKPTYGYFGVPLGMVIILGFTYHINHTQIT